MINLKIKLTFLFLFFSNVFLNVFHEFLGLQRFPTKPYKLVLMVERNDDGQLLLETFFQISLNWWITCDSMKNVFITNVNFSHIYIFLCFCGCNFLTYLSLMECCSSLDQCTLLLKIRSIVSSIDDNLRKSGDQL